MPDAFIIAGPNGAGKTTYARRFLPDELRLPTFANADLIAAGLSPFAPDRAALDAGRIMLRRIRELVAARADLAFETTLSGRSYAALFRDMRAAGYRIDLEFLWISDLAVCRDRIRQRVAKGGHDVPDDVQRRRFHLGLRNLATLYRPLIDHWRLVDNTGGSPRVVCEETDGRLSACEPALLAQVERSAGIQLMPEPPTGRVEEPPARTPEELSRCAMRALRKAYADAVLENLRFGLPVIQLRDGEVVAVPAEELAPRARRILEANGELLPEEIARNNPPSAG